MNINTLIHLASWIFSSAHLFALDFIECNSLIITIFHFPPSLYEHCFGCVFIIGKSFAIIFFKKIFNM